MRNTANRFPVGINNSVLAQVVMSGASIDVNASNDLIDITNLTQNPNSNWTFGLLLNPLRDGTLYNQNIYSQNNGTGVGRGLATSPLVGQFYSCALGNVTRNSNQKPVIGIWQWLFYSNLYNAGAGTNTLDMYFMIKGSVGVRNIGTFSGITYENANGNHRLLASKNDTITGTGTRCYDGYMGDYKYWNTALTQSQINSAITKNEFPTDSLLCHLNIEETSGTDIADQSGNGNNGTLVNGAAINTSITPWPARAVVERQVVNRPIV